MVVGAGSTRVRLRRGSFLPFLDCCGDHDVVGRTAVRLGDELQRLDERDLEVFLVEQGGERLGGEFLEVWQGERALIER
jgi:hypothetical protein